VPPKERSPSPDDGLLREEPLESEKEVVKPGAPVASTEPSSVATTELPAAAAFTTESEENPPPKPPRPVSLFDKNVATLAEAFPDVDLAVVKAVLTASAGRVEPAFNALLGMTDPSAAVTIDDDVPPPQPPRPRGGAPQQTRSRDFRGDHYSHQQHQQQPETNPPGYKTSTSLSQLEADELFARQLAGEGYGASRGQSGRGGGTRQGRGGFGNYPENREDNKEHSFIDDELPVITENIKKGFFETQTKVNKFFTDFGKKLTGEDESTPPGQHPGDAGASGPREGGGGPYPARYSSRRSGDAYDADPAVIQDDFSHLEMRDNTGENPPRRPNRPLANPNLFDPSDPNPSSTTATAGTGARKVAFSNQSEEDLYRKAPPSSKSGATGGGGGAPLHSALRGSSPGSATKTTSKGGSKWESLETVEPTPLNDPFQLADSDDDHEGGNGTTVSSKTGPQETGTKSAK